MEDGSGRSGGILMGTIDYKVLDGKTGSWYKENSFWADRKVLVHPKAGIVPNVINLSG